MFKYKTQPFKHQIEALRMSANKKNFAYFMEMGCVDGETEFLTQRGWVKFKDFELEEWERPLLVAQAIPDPKDLSHWKCQFVEPISYIKKPAHEWVWLAGRKSPGSSVEHDSTLMFTKDHEIPILFLNRDNPSSIKEPDMPDATAEFIHKVLEGKTDITASQNHLMYVNKIKGGMIPTDSQYYIPDPEISQLNEWEIRFMVAAIADGTFPNKRDNKCDFYFTKDRKAERLRMIAAKAGISMAYEYVKGAHKDTHVFHTIAPIKCKVFDERWYCLTQDMLRVIVNEIFHWDGWIGKKDAYFYTTIKDTADFVQYAMAMCGWDTPIYFNGPKKLYSIKGNYRKCEDHSLFPADYCDAGNSAGRIQGANIIKYSKTIEEEIMSYCFRVPSGFMLFRRDNRIFIASNSGKTKVMLDNIGYLYTEEKITGALVLAPKGVYRNWSEKEIPTHLSDDVPREVLVWDAAASQGKKDKLAQQIRDYKGDKLQCLVFNIESLISQKGRKLIDDFVKRHGGRVLVLVDESTCIKNHKAKRTKAAIDIASKCIARRIATGSPVTNSPLDLYSQCAFLDKSLLGCGSYYAFKNTYANIEKVQNRQGQHYEKILSYKNLDHLSELLDKFSYRITKKECLDLPEKIYMTRDVELTPEQLKIYNEMYNYQFALLQKDEEFKEMSAQVILTKFLRLHQVLCGTFVSDDGTIENIPNNRISALHDVLEETSGKVIIWATYLNDINAIAKMLEENYGPESFVMYYGATTSEDRTKAIEQFQDESSPVRFFLGNVQTAGRGITLTAASTVVYYSNNFSLELRQQSEDRAHRLGQKNKVTYVDLVVRGSLDEKIIKSLVEKRNIANEVLKDDLDDWISLKPV